MANEAALVPPADVIAALQRLCPEVGRDISDHWRAPLVSYAAHLWRPTAAPTSRIGMAARSILRDTLLERLLEKLSPTEAAIALAEFDGRAVVQTGLHSQLLLDRITFDAFLLGWLGAVENGLSTFFAFTGATVTMETVGREGPGWLGVGSERINLFGMGRHKLCRQSACAAGPVSLNKRTLETLSQRIGDVSWLNVLLDRADEPFATAADALGALNTDLASAWDGPAAVRPVFFDDRHAALAVARHLEDEDGLLTRLLTDPDRRSRLEQALEHAACGPFGRFLPAGTVHFWGVRDKRVRKLVVENGSLIEAQRPNGVSVPLDREHLLVALRQGLLLPNLFLLFVVIALLPRVRVLGGFRQIGYVPIFQSVLMEALDPHAAEECELAEELGVRENAWGMRVVEEPGSVHEQLARMPAGPALPELRRRYQQLTLREVTDDLRLIRESSRWKKNPGLRPSTQEFPQRSLMPVNAR